MSSVQHVVSTVPVQETDAHIDPHDAERAWRCGIDPCVIIYASSIHPNGGIQRAKERWEELGLRIYDRAMWEDPELRSILWRIDEDRFTTRLMASIKRDYSGFLMLDPEAGFIWPTLSSFMPGEACWTAGFVFANRLIALVKEWAENARVGYYFTGYVWQNWASTMDRVLDTYKKVKAQRKDLNVDVWYPSIYDRESGDEPGEYQHQHAKVFERLVLFKQDHRPSFCVVNPRVMDPRRPDPLMKPAEFDRDQLDLAIDAGADGVAVWDPRYHGITSWTPDEMRGLNPSQDWKRAHQNWIVSETLFRAYRRLVLERRV